MKVPKKYQFIVDIGKALHIYGIPSYKIQSYLTQVAKTKGITGSFMDLPTWINYVFYEDKNSYNYIESIPPGSLNLGAFSRIDELTNKVIDTAINEDEIEEELKIIHAKTKEVNHFYLTLAHAFAAGSFSMMIGSNWISFGFALLLGALTYLLVFLSTKSKYIESVFESLSALVITIISCVLTYIFPNFNLGLTILASIIIFIPGLAITTALEEITSKSLVAGSAKLFDAIVALFKQFFGVILGLGLMTSLIDIDLTYYASNLPKWTIFLAIPMFSITVLPIFQVRKKEMFFGVLTGILAFFLTVILSSGLGILGSTFIATLAVVGISRIFGRISKTPKSVYLTQGIVMLVPGSKSFMGLSNSFFNPSITASANLFGEVAFILMGIIGGLLFAGTFREKRNKRD